MQRTGTFYYRKQNFRISEIFTNSYFLFEMFQCIYNTLCYFCCSFPTRAILPSYNIILYQCFSQICRFQESDKILLYTFKRIQKFLEKERRAVRTKRPGDRSRVKKNMNLISKYFGFLHPDINLLLNLFSSLRNIWNTIYNTKIKYFILYTTLWK